MTEQNSPPNADAGGDLMPIVKGRLVPLTWAIECPACLEAIEIEHVSEDDSGLFFADYVDTAVDCPACRVAIVSDAVEIRPHVSPTAATESPAKSPAEGFPAWRTYWDGKAIRD